MREIKDSMMSYVKSIRSTVSIKSINPKPKDKTMNCWSCGTELIWGGDHNGEDYCNEEYNIVTNLSCPKCDAFVLVYHQPNESFYHGT